MPNTKLINLGQFKTGLERTKSYIDAQDQILSGQIADVVADIEGLVATGGEANILEGIKVNEKTLEITDKIAELLIETGSENGTINVAGAAVAVAGLKKLAFVDEISENEFSDALKASFAAKATNADLEALETVVSGIDTRVGALEQAGYQTAAQCETIAMAAVAASGHAHFEKVDAVPAASDAVENVMYLVPATDGDGFVIYAKVGDAVEPLGHTKVDLSGYSTTEQMNAAINAAIEGIKIGDYAKLADLNAAVERIGALETALANYYTKTEIDGLFGGYYSKTEMDNLLAAKMNVADMGAYSTDDEATAKADQALADAKTYADQAVANAKASDSEVSSALDGVFGSEN